MTKILMFYNLMKWVEVHFFVVKEQNNMWLRDRDVVVKYNLDIPFIETITINWSMSHLHSAYVSRALIWRELMPEMRGSLGKLKYQMTFMVNLIT